MDFPPQKSFIINKESQVAYFTKADSVFRPWTGTRPRPIFQGQGRMTDILHARAYALVGIVSTSPFP